jgi:hypothetical protein
VCVTVPWLGMCMCDQCRGWACACVTSAVAGFVCLCVCVRPVLCLEVCVCDQCRGWACVSVQMCVTGAMPIGNAAKASVGDETSLW